MAWEDPEGSSRGGALREAARIIAVVVAAVAGGAGLLVLITQVLAPPPPRVTVPPHRAAVAAATPSPAPSLAPLPTAPEAPPRPPPTAPDGVLPDQYLGDLSADGGTNPGEIAGLDYRFSHGFGMFLGRTTQVRFVVPDGYRSMTATLKGLGGSIRFTLSVGGQPVLDRTLSPYQPPMTVTCAAPAGAAVVLAGLFEGGGSLPDAVAVWGDARFSPAPAAAPGCSP